jgi:GT2 family glycosyltransferase
MMTQQSHILISILNWHNAPSTINAINSVLKLNYLNYEILIIDNASKDNSLEVLRKKFPKLKFKVAKSNLGYAGGNKIAADYAIKNGFDALWILNNDVIVEPDSLETLVAAWKKYKNAIFGSITINSDGTTISFAGGAEMQDHVNVDRNSGYNSFAGLNYSENKQEIKTRIVSDLNGSSIFIPRDIIKQYGFISTSWFLYGEETDYCYMLRKRHSISSILVADSIVVHAGSATLKMHKRLCYIKNYYLTRNINILYKRHFKDFRITGFGSYSHLLKFFTKHYLLNSNNKSHEYLESYYTKLGQLHSLLRIRGKYLRPEKFL